MKRSTSSPRPMRGSLELGATVALSRGRAHDAAGARHAARAAGHRGARGRRRRGRLTWRRRRRSARRASAATTPGSRCKRRLRDHLRGQGLAVEDVGTDTPDPVDYPDIAAAVARLVARGEVDAGIVIDGAGLGSAIAANKIDGVRAAMCTDRTLARYAREHNGANVLALGATLVTVGGGQGDRRHLAAARRCAKRATSAGSPRSGRWRTRCGERSSRRPARGRPAASGRRSSPRSWPPPARRRRPRCACHGFALDCCPHQVQGVLAAGRRPARAARRRRRRRRGRRRSSITRCSSPMRRRPTSRSCAARPPSSASPPCA